MQLQHSLWRENLKYSHNHKLQVNVLNANRKIAWHTKNKFSACFSEVQHLWFLYRDVLLLMVTSEPALSGNLLCWSRKENTSRAWLPCLQWFIQEWNGAHTWETDPRRPAMLGLLYNTPALHPACTHNHSADACPVSAAIHLILIYSCSTHPQCCLCFLVFRGENLQATLAAAAMLL